MGNGPDKRLFAANSFSFSLRSLLEILRLDDTLPFSGNQPALNGLDGDFATVVLNHHLLWCSLDAIKRHQLPLPAASIEPLKNRYVSQASHALRVAARLKSITLLLESEHLAYLPLKGVLLGQQLYGDPSHRHPGDIDLLVEEEQVVKACTLLAEAGYEPVVPATWPSPSQWKVLLRSHQHVALKAPDGAVLLELHWKAERTPRCFGFSRIKEELVSFEMMGHHFPQLPDDLLLVYLAVHGSKHGWASLHWLYDFALLARGLDQSVWQQVLARARSCGYMDHLANACFLAEELFHTPLPSGILNSLSAYRPGRRLRRMVVRRIENGNPITIGEQFHHLAYSMVLERGIRGKLAVLQKELIDPKEWSRYKLPAPLFFLYYLIRPLSMLYRRLLRPIFGRDTRANLFGRKNRHE